MSPPPEPRHVSVLPDELVRLLDPRPGETWVDCTVGGGGHSRLVAERIGPTGRLVGLDQDPTMLDLARPRLAGLPVALAHANFDQLAEGVARRVVERRQVKPFATTAELAEVVRRSVPRSGGIDPATRVFQALRVAVNDELGALDRLLAMLPRVVKPGGRAGVVSFHSLED